VGPQSYRAVDRTGIESVVNALDTPGVGFNTLTTAP
jgi:hypothetical protein